MQALVTTLATLLEASPVPRVVLAHDHRQREPTADAATPWDARDENLARFAAAAASHQLSIEQLVWERPTDEEQAIGRHEVSIIEVVKADSQGW